MYSRLPDEFAFDKRVIRAGPEPVALYARALARTAQKLSDGVITRADLQMLTIYDIPSVLLPEAQAQVLVEVGLWEVFGDGWRIVDYLPHNMSATEYIQWRERQAAGGRKGGRSRALSPRRSNGQFQGRPESTLDAQPESSPESQPHRSSSSSSSSTSSSIGTSNGVPSSESLTLDDVGALILDRWHFSLTPKQRAVVSEIADRLGPGTRGSFRRIVEILTTSQGPDPIAALIAHDRRLRQEGTATARTQEDESTRRRREEAPRRRTGGFTTIDGRAPRPARNALKPSGGSS